MVTKWELPVKETDLLTTEMNSQTASGGLSSLGGAFDNQAGKDIWGMFVLNVTFASAPTAGGVVDLHLIPRVDLTNFVDSASPLFNATLVCSFTVRAVATAQRIVGRGFIDGGPIIQLPPLQVKAITVNNADQALTASGHTLSVTTFNREIP